MNRNPLLAFLLPIVLVAFASPARAQVSFFQAPVVLGAGNIFVADFNGDGKLDILASSSGGGYLSPGNGDGTFAHGTGVSGKPLAVADFNGDSKLDILEQTTGTLNVLLGNGDGTFQSPGGSPSGASLLVVAAADVNGDGRVDVVGISGNTLFIYLGKGDGTFESPISSNLGSTATATAVLLFGDFNGDGKLDVVINIGNLGSGTGILLAARGASLGSQSKNF